MDIHMSNKETFWTYAKSSEIGIHEMVKSGPCNTWYSGSNVWAKEIGIEDDR